MEKKILLYVKWMFSIAMVLIIGRLLYMQISSPAAFKMLRSEMPAVGWFITLMPFVMLLLVLFFMYRSKKINLEGDERNVRMKLAASYGTFG